MTDKKKSEEMLRRAERLKKQAGQAHRRAGRNRNPDKPGFDLSDVFTGFAAIAAFYERILKPVATHRWTGAPFRLYGRIWNAVVYAPPEAEEGETSPQDAEEVFSSKRAAMMVLGTLVFLWWLPAMLATLGEAVIDATRMATTYKKNETWYLGKSQEIDPAGNVFSAQGCESIQCSDQTSIYFRIKPSLVHHIWSFVHTGNIFFPDYVSAGIQNDINKCVVTGYGSRIKFFVRNWDIYPQILSVNCIPVSEDEIKAVQPVLSPDDQIDNNE